MSGDDSKKQNIKFDFQTGYELEKRIAFVENVRRASYSLRIKDYNIWEIFLVNHLLIRNPIGSIRC